jgi:hypothetical protein
MEVLDVNGKQISNGLQVKYIGTHTVGKVDKILIKEEIAWIKLDSIDLYYRSDYIEVIESKNTIIKQNKSNRFKSKSRQFKVKIPVEISDTTDGPGVGGG